MKFGLRWDETLDYAKLYCVRATLPRVYSRRVAVQYCTSRSIHTCGLACCSPSIHAPVNRAAHTVHVGPRRLRLVHPLPLHIPLRGDRVIVEAEAMLYDGNHRVLCALYPPSCCAAVC